MLDLIRTRLTYSNVMVTVLMFVVLGGGAYAAHSHKIGTKDLGNRAVTTKKLAGNAVGRAKLKNRAVSAAKIAPGGVGTAAIADGAVTGDKVDEATLGPVPSAQQAADAGQLGGIGSDGFIQGTGRSFAFVADDPEQGSHEVLIPGIGEVIYLCAAGGGNTGLLFKNTAAVEVLAWGIASRDTGAGATTSIDFESLVTSQELDVLVPDGPGTSHLKVMVRPDDPGNGLGGATIEVLLEATGGGCQWLTTVSILG